jgi:hypothetical protein
MSDSSAALKIVSEPPSADASAEFEARPAHPSGIAPIDVAAPGLAPRFAALVMLGVVAAFFGYGAVTAYRSLRDSFVAPAILSPDSDIVLANRLKLSEMAQERARAAADIEGIDAEIAAETSGLDRLVSLKQQLENSVQWTRDLTSEKAATGAAQLNALEREKEVVAEMIDRETALSKKAEADVAAGVISRTDYAKETQTLNQLQVALIDNERAMVESRAAVRESELTQRAISFSPGAPLTPDLAARAEQMIRVDLDSIKLEADRRSRLAQRKELVGRIADIDDLTQKLESRPIYRAAEGNLDVAFVPYTQIDGVATGDSVYSCVWGLFHCKEVGTVAEIVSGEVATADPWGSPARGQYVVLDLWDRSAAKEKTLRVRSGSAAKQTSATSGAR